MPIANPMARTSKIIGFKAFHDCDSDILEWWDSMPNGERSHILRTLIRSYLTGQIVTQSVKDDPLAFANSVQLAQLRTETLKIRDAMQVIPNYLEQLIAKSQQALSPAAKFQSQPLQANFSAGDDPSQLSLSHLEATRRAARIKQTKW